MIFQEWLKENGHSQVWAAKKLGVPTRRVSCWVNNICQPDAESIWGVAILTDGDVNIEDWVNQIRAAREKCFIN